jgi:hypothetical protein
LDGPFATDSAGAAIEAGRIRDANLDLRSGLGVKLHDITHLE